MILFMDFLRLRLFYVMSKKYPPNFYKKYPIVEWKYLLLIKMRIDKLIFRIKNEIDIKKHATVSYTQP